MVESRPGEPSLAFSGRVGETCPSGQLPPRDYLLVDWTRFDSEGNWAFCRFDGVEVPAVRFGFQRGGFNIGAQERSVDRNFLQLHLEIVTRQGALLWLPSGEYPAAAVVSDSQRMDIHLEHDGREVFRIQGWPEMEWHFRSEEGDAEVDLHFVLDTATVLPDCILPQCVFAMWAATGRAEGSVRFEGRAERVRGVVFYDHPRIVSGPNPVPPRKVYLYTTMFFADGSRILGYHAVDERDQPISYYCFGLYIDPVGRGHFLPETRTTRLEIDADNLPERWVLDWRCAEVQLEARITVRDPGLKRAWGSPGAPKSRRQFIILPLALEGQAVISERGRRRTQAGLGLAEYFNQEHWSARGG
jgi:hypothetical protein